MKEALVRKQVKIISFEIDLTRSRQEFRKFFSFSIITHKESAKFFDSVIFIESNYLTFKDQYFNMTNKPRMNEDHFDSKRIKAVYVT